MSETSLVAGSVPVCKVTIADLRSGRRARVNEREYAQLSGKSVYTLQRNRWKKKGIPWMKDDSGRVWYAAEDVVADLDRVKHTSTQEYDTRKEMARLDAAREAREVACLAPTWSTRLLWMPVSLKFCSGQSFAHSTG
jgi:hypothetical protein